MEKTTLVAKKKLVLRSTHGQVATAEQVKAALQTKAKPVKAKTKPAAEAAPSKPVKAAAEREPRETKPLVQSKDNLFDRLHAHTGLTAKNNSQMSRVIEYGVSAGTAEREDAEKRAKVEARITSLKKTIGHVTEANGWLALLPTLSTVDAKEGLLAKALRRVNAICEHPNLPMGASKPMRKMRNELVSAREGLVTDGVLAAFTEGTSALEELQRVLASAEDTHMILLHGNDAYMEKLYDRAKEIIQRTGNEARRLESLKDKPMVISRVPVVPLTDPPLNTDVLSRMHVKTENLGGYPLLHNQLVIGINREALTKSGRKTEKPMEAVERYLKVLSKQMGRNIMPVSTEGVPGSGGVWYWLADEKTINALRKAGRDQLKIRSWGFGWGTSNAKSFG